MDLLHSQIDASTVLQEAEEKMREYINILSITFSLGNAELKEQIRASLDNFKNHCISHGRLQITLENTLTDGTQKS